MKVATTVPEPTPAPKPVTSAPEWETRVRGIAANPGLSFPNKVLAIHSAYLADDRAGWDAALFALNLIADLAAQEVRK